MCISAYIYKILDKKKEKKKETSTTAKVRLWQIRERERERERESKILYPEVPNSESLPRLEKMMSATSASHSTESS